MLVRLLLFAGLREAVGKKEHLLEVSAGATVADVLAAVEEAFPDVARYRGRLIVSLNEERAGHGEPVADGDELALLPPMSGGSLDEGSSVDEEGDAGAARVQAAPLSLDALVARVLGPDTGGLVTFTGTVRNHARGEPIDHLEYEAYVPMAEREMRKIAREAEARWPGVRVAMAHRVGHLEIGDAAVMIAAAGAHRPEAFEACRWAIDTLKETVPIWKKEFASSGAYWVEENP